MRKDYSGLNSFIRELTFPELSFSCTSALQKKN